MSMDASIFRFLASAIGRLSILRPIFRLPSNETIFRFFWCRHTSVIAHYDLKFPGDT